MRGPDLEWRGDVPVSRQFGDVYFNPEDGAGESRHVFLEGNDLPARLATASSGTFHVGEVGFGTGLNFLVTCEYYRKHEPAARLVYYSCEQYPFAPADLRRALSAFPAPGAEAGELLEHYPPAVPGMHRIVLAGGRVLLNLLWGDAVERLSALSGSFFDAWYLDGFAPSKNPELWTAEVIAQVARLSRPGATLATFSVAGAVRRELAAAGFRVTKAPGFGRKREMLKAVLSEPSPAPPVLLKGSSPVVVIGAGLAGTAVAEAITRRGRRVILIEREGEPGPGASGNGAGLAFPWLTAEPTYLSRLSLAAFSYLGCHLRRMQTKSADLMLERCGVLQLFHTPAMARRLERALAAHELPPEVARVVEANVAEELAGVRPAVGGLFFPGGVMLSPRALCSAHLEAARATGLLEVIYHRAALRIESFSGGWRARDEQGDPIAEGSALVLCAAADSMNFEPTAWLPLRRVRGQVLRAPARPESATLKAGICYDGYITPAAPTGEPAAKVDGERGHEHWIGATFEEWNESREKLPEQNRWLFDKASQWLPDWAPCLENAEPEVWPARVAFRSAARDRFPIIGRVPNRPVFEKIVREQNRITFPPGGSGAYLPGLRVSTAHGSRGILTAPLGAEIIASGLFAETSPISADLLQALDPGRFLLRELRARSKGR